MSSFLERGYCFTKILERQVPGRPPLPFDYTQLAERAASEAQLSHEEKVHSATGLHRIATLTVHDSPEQGVLAPNNSRRCGDAAGAGGHETENPGE